MSVYTLRIDEKEKYSSTKSDCNFFQFAGSLKEKKKKNCRVDKLSVVANESSKKSEYFFVNLERRKNE